MLDRYDLMHLSTPAPSGALYCASSPPSDTADTAITSAARAARKGSSARCLSAAVRQQQFAWTCQKPSSRTS